MKSIRKNIETKQRNHAKTAQRIRNWISVVAVLALPTPCWSQFKQPVLSDLTAGRGNEWGATFSSDMLEAYWVVHGFDHIWDIWGANRESIDAPWEDVEQLDIVTTGALESSPYLSTDGLTLTFASNRGDGGYGGLDLWQTTRENGNAPWKEPVNMGPTINTRGNEGNATFSSDGLEVIFNSGCDGGGPCSPTRLRRSTRDTLADEWTPPESMTSSGRGDEVGFAAHPSLSLDGLSLYFNAPGSFGNWDVFVSKRPSLDALFGERENLGAPINSRGRDTTARIAPDGSLYYGYNGSGGKLRIWRAESVLPGDLDKDGGVDGNDFLKWQLGLGSTYNASDLNNWRVNFGATSAAVVASTAIPEPGTLLLGALACCSLLLRKYH